MKKDIQETLIAPRYIILVRLVQGKKFVHKLELPHTRQIHEHHARVQT